ncbi:MAG TPA: tetratricopeptide repeat protein [Cyclobacteriaceae bacterium]|nr:tetratricopeptide repeat protein [Cyclobacteriaceae bacterium]
MKTVVALMSIVLAITFVALRSDDTPAVYPKPRDFPITMCGSAWIDAMNFGTPVTLIDGLGTLHYRINTRDSLAQKFFDQGLRLIYAFNHVEALRAFKEASRLDPSCAMAWWGQALTLGPNINDWNPKDREEMAMQAINKAKELSAGAKQSSQKEKDFIIALASRYDGKVHDDREPLNVAYRDAMEKLSKKYPADPEALVLYADAIMTSMPWDYWNKDGSPKNLTSSARVALESAIKKYPRHPGAHHMYIHLVEASNKPGDAHKSAEFLETAMPSAGHIVHMPSHIYARTGEYERSNNSNRLAIKADEEFLSRSDDQGLYRIGYYPHNIDFLAYGTLMNGQSETAITVANKLAYHVKAIETVVPAYYDYYFNAPIIAFVRYGKWSDVLALPVPDDKNYHTSAIHHYARGTAFLRTKNITEAKRELSKLDSISKLDTLKTIYAFFNSTEQIVKVAADLLKGEVLINEGKLDEGLSALRQAVANEDDLRYNEPPDWRLPARHFLGAALFEAGRYADAQKVFEDDLFKNPENGWALKGLLNCHQKSGQTTEALQVEKRLSAAWSKGDVTIPSSRF